MTRRITYRHHYPTRPKPPAFITDNGYFPVSKPDLATGAGSQRPIWRAACEAVAVAAMPGWVRHDSWDAVGRLDRHPSVCYALPICCCPSAEQPGYKYLSGRGIA